MIRFAAERIGRVARAGGRGIRQELRDGHFRAADVEDGQIDRALGVGGRPPFVLVRLRIDRRVAPHHERPRRDLDEAEQRIVRQEPGVRAMAVQ